MFLFSVFLVLWHLGLPDQGKTAASRASQFSEVAEDSPVAMAFIGKPTHPEPCGTINTLLFLAKPLSPCPNYPRAGYQTNSDRFYAPQPAGIIQTSQSEACSATDPASLIPPCKVHNTSFAQAFT